MDSAFNDNEDNIRPPDEVVIDRLLEDTRSEYEKQIEEALILSLDEIRNKDNLNKKYEEQLLKDFSEESNKRKQIFEKFLFDLNKVGKIDKEVREIYDIIEPIVESYCSQYINKCELDIETYEKIFKLLGKIRTDKTAVEFLKTIILKDEFSS
jgi:hypothetical protein